jgi:predicted  nucleic acid-binding Zn-ribbon protein
VFRTNERKTYTNTDRTNETLNCLSAMCRDIGELRTELRTQIGEARAGMDKANAEVIEARLDLLPVRTELLNLRSEIREVRTDVRAIADRLDRLEAKILNTPSGVDELASKQA